jgi:hypothetical protein
MKKLMLLSVPLLVILGSCPSPVEGPEVEDTGGTAISIDFVSGGLVVERQDGTNALEGENLIWRDGDPSWLSLGVSSGDWTDIKWYLDGSGVPFATGPSVVLEAFRYRETTHTLTFTGLYKGTPCAALIPFTVMAYRAADIVWTQTENDSSLTDFDLAAWTGWDDSLEAWELGVVEQPLVYFAVHKQPGQIITPGGTDGTRVSKAAPGTTVDGSTASEILDVFTVDAGDTLFAGGSRNFTLTVTEAGKTQNKIVTVNLTVRPRPTGIALFRVDGEGRLTRLTPDNAADHANSYYASHKAGTFPEWGLDFAEVTNLATAIKWLNNYAKSGTESAWSEYLIRVEQNEALDKTALHCYGGMPLPEIAADYVRIRLRGYGGERVLTHNESNITDPYIYKWDKTWNRSFDMGNGFLNVGLHNQATNISSGPLYGLNHVALHLEENITIDAAGGTDPYFPNQDGPKIRSMVSVDKNCSFVMEPGSRLVNYNDNPSSSLSVSDFCAVVVYREGVFEMRGGEMADIKCGFNIVYVAAAGNGEGAGKFVYRDGAFNGNNSNFIGIYPSTLKIYYDTAFRPQD